MKNKENPEEGQEAVIKYKITNSKGEILDQTEGRKEFKFIVGDTQTIMKCISDAVMTMKYEEKKTLEINTDEDPNILDILGEEQKNLPENKKLKIDLELVRFGNISRSIFELTDEEKFDHAKNLKTQFVVLYTQKNYQKGLEIIKEAVSVIEKINKENKTEEINKFYITLLLNECNCMNNLKDYSNTVKVGQKVIEMDQKSLKAYYYMGNAYAYLDEYKDATKCYDKLYELMPNKDDPGVIALNNLITKRRKVKEENARRKFRAFLAQKDK
jgi:tetratricopeptide (TPR) repeat protein